MENSLSAIRAAADAGYGIEIDVQPSKDGTPMVFHDSRLDRLTRLSGKIAAQPTERLSQTRLSGSTDTIPTLAEALTVIDGRVPLVIEIKDQDGRMGARVGALEARVAACLAGYGGPVALMSFNPHSVAACKEAAPLLPRGLLTCNYRKLHWPHLDKDTRRALAAAEGFSRLGLAFLSHAHKELHSPTVRIFRELGLPIVCWTIRNAKEEAKARRVADQVTFEGYKAACPA